MQAKFLKQLNGESSFAFLNMNILWRAFNLLDIRNICKPKINSALSFGSAPKQRQVKGYNFMEERKLAKLPENFSSCSIQTKINPQAVAD